MPLSIPTTPERDLLAVTYDKVKEIRVVDTDDQSKVLAIENLAIAGTKVTVAVDGLPGTVDGAFEDVLTKIAGKADTAQVEALDAEKLDIANVYNALDKTDEGFALDARQGKALDDVDKANYAKSVEMIAHNATAPSPIIPTGTTKTYEFSDSGTCAWITLGSRLVERGDLVDVKFTAPSTYVRTFRRKTNLLYTKNKLNVIFDGNHVQNNTGDHYGDTYPLNTRKTVYLMFRIGYVYTFEKATIDSNNDTGDIYFVQYRESGGIYTLINSKLIQNNEVDLSDFVFQQNDWCGTYLLSDTAVGGVKYKDTGGDSKYIGNQSSLPVSISGATLTSSTALFSLKLIGSSEVSIYEQAEKIEQYKKVGNIVYTNFRSSNFPSPWTNNGFTATADGMKSPATGGMNTMIEYEQYSNLDSFMCLFKFNMAELSNVMICNFHKKLTTIGGHVVGFNLITGYIVVYSAVVKGGFPSTLVSSKIPYTIVTGETIIRYERNAMIERYTVINGSNSYTFSYDTQTKAQTTGAGYDKFGFIFYSGNVTVEEAQYSCQLPKEPDVLILGDSVVNGDTIRYLNGGGYKNRWAGLLSKKTLVSIASLGGNTSTDIARDMAFYLSIFKPNKCIYAIGLNDTVLETFTTNTDAFISACESAGIEPILQTFYPRDDRLQYCLDASEWVKSRGVRYIDFRRRMTTDGLGLNRIQSLFLADNIHPNVAGHLEMYNEVLNTL